MSAPEDITVPTELLILPDGRVFGHNLSPEVASLLRVLNPEDPLMRERASAAEPPLQS